jgi:hypothetical protein
MVKKNELINLAIIVLWFIRDPFVTEEFLKEKSIRIFSLVQAKNRNKWMKNFSRKKCICDRLFKVAHWQEEMIAK